jgi:hypothetical protein
MTAFRRGEAPSSQPFEAALLPEPEKERLCRELLDEFQLRVHSHSATRKELIIPCVLGEHRNQDHDPTAALNYKKLTFKCLGCKRSGGLLWFIAEHRGGSSTEARKWLAKETGTDGEVMDLSALLRFFQALYGTKGERAPMPIYDPQVLDPWRLLHPWVTDPIEYDADGRNVGGRGVPEENAVRFQIGYSERFPMGFRVKADGTRQALPPSERIVIPHFWRGDLVGWQTRRLASDGTPKYKSSTDFPKDSTLFNYAPERFEEVNVFESPFSVLVQDREDFHTVATFGADITERQAKLLGRYKRVVFHLDNDPAGWGAYLDLTDRRGKVTKKGILETVAQYTDVWAVESPFSADPGEMDNDDLRDLHSEAVPWVIWQRPNALTCYRCMAKAHDGGCA